MRGESSPAILAVSFIVARLFRGRQRHAAQRGDNRMPAELLVTVLLLVPIMSANLVLPMAVGNTDTTDLGSWRLRLA